MSPIIEGSRKLGGRLSLGEVKSAVAEYDFAVDGGAVGDIALRGDQIPAGAVVLDALVYVDTVLASGGAATVALKLEDAADLNAAGAFDGAPWSAVGPVRPDFTSADPPIETTDDRDVVATVAAAALTGGKFRVVVFYLELA